MLMKTRTTLAYCLRVVKCFSEKIIWSWTGLKERTHLTVFLYVSACEVNVCYFVFPLCPSQDVRYCQPEWRHRKADAGVKDGETEAARRISGSHPVGRGKWIQTRHFLHQHPCCQPLQIAPQRTRQEQ